MKKIKLMLGFFLVMAISCFAAATMPGDEILDAFNDNRYRLCSPMPYKGRDPAFGCPKIEKINYSVIVHEDSKLQKIINDYMNSTIIKYSQISDHYDVKIIDSEYFINVRSGVRKGSVRGVIPDPNSIEINFIVKLDVKHEYTTAYVVGLISSNSSYDIVTNASDPMQGEDVRLYLEKMVEKFIHNQLAPNVFPDARAKIEARKHSDSKNK